ncbi:hypothetical protein HNQ07_002236 [Deinococcus metalli]|uniref:C-deglycosylation enzyme beta subunit n=1 Tax=Deinococcus metalli TaxID=1141878 RepID=A0A7W8KEL8_9DEIO|nr:DUF6379 domain-containing protein [Deinococcus metalli]MBB5376772.1 hypothetical protein [Deinococcus metalli]GHF45237.1 hypothetical protein GCM10017781_22010 [Deinococcus metalli]
MFDRYIVVEDTLKDVPQGTQVGVRLPYYRGLGLSMVEAVDVTVDGVSADPAAVSVTLGDHTYPLSTMDEEYDAVWNFGEIGTVTVAGLHLAPGPHDVRVRLQLRVSYLPMKLVGQDSKTLELAAG